MQDKVPVTVFQPTEHHNEPALDVSRLEYNAFLFDDHFQIAVEELQNEVDILLVGKDVDELEP